MKKQLYALFLAMAMVFAMSITAAATTVPTVGTGTETQEATVSITKDLLLAEGISVPEATFQFEVTALTEDAPAASIAPITYSSQSTPAGTPDDHGIVKVTQTSPMVFEAFPHAGVYEYTVSETAGTYTGEGTMIYSQNVYTLRVYVANQEDGSVYIQTITAEQDGTKQDEVLFTNTYTKTAVLEIAKETQGNLANKLQSFDFTIRINPPANSSQTEFVGHTDGTDGVEVRCPAGQETAFTLHHGQTLLFDTLPAGTRYVVTELGAADGYIPSVSVTENGQMLPEKQGSADEDGITSLPPDATSNLVGEQENSVRFVNNHQDIPITGIVMNNLPFLLLIGAAVAALAVLSVLKRRNSAHHG